jgi:hypothetical protein
MYNMIICLVDRIRLVWITRENHLLWFMCIIVFTIASFMIE